MISVIIPLYNKESIIERSLQSVLSQDYDDFEVVVVNDGSTDRSAEIVKDIHDSRVTLIEQENGGPSKARNTGVKHAKGEWVVFLDADDELLPGALKYFNSIILIHKEVDIVDCNNLFRTGNHVTAGKSKINGYIKNPLRELFFGRISPGCGRSIFRCEFILKHPYNEHIRRYEDVELLTRILENAVVYSTNHPTMIHNNDYAEASRPRGNIYEDFLGYLNIDNIRFWKKMCIYSLYLGERENYPIECKQLYNSWYYRYDLLLCYKILNNLKRYL